MSKEIKGYSKAFVEICSPDSRERQISAVIFSHLLIENSIEDYIRDHSPNRGKFGFSKFFKRSSFSSKLNTAAILGLDMDAFRLIRELNDIRNDFAHNLNHSIDVEKWETLEKSLTAELRTYYMGQIAGIVDTYYEGDREKLSPEDKFIALALSVIPVVQLMKLKI